MHSFCAVSGPIWLPKGPELKKLGLIGPLTKYNEHLPQASGANRPFTPDMWSKCKSDLVTTSGVNEPVTPTMWTKCWSGTGHSSRDLDYMLEGTTPFTPPLSHMQEWMHKFRTTP